MHALRRIRAIATDWVAWSIGRSVSMCVCVLCVCWSRSWVLQKWLNRLRCRLGADMGGPKELSIRWGRDLLEERTLGEGWPIHSKTLAVCCSVRSKRDHSILNNSTTCDAAFRHILCMPTVVAWIGFSATLYVCLFVCLFLCLFTTRYPQNRCGYHRTRHRNVHHEFWKPIYFGVKRSKVKVTSHKKTTLCLSLEFRWNAYISYDGFSPRPILLSTPVFPCDEF